jgi:hypothetical protein
MTTFFREGNMISDDLLELRCTAVVCRRTVSKDGLSRRLGATVKHVWRTFNDLSGHYIARNSRQNLPRRVGGVINRLSHQLVRASQAGARIMGCWSPWKPQAMQLLEMCGSDTRPICVRTT